jgi:hypothetical protein
VERCPGEREIPLKGIDALRVQRSRPRLHEDYESHRALGASLNRTLPSWFILGLLLVTQVDGEPSWVPVTASNGSFSVQFFGKPKREMGTLSAETCPWVTSQVLEQGPNGYLMAFEVRMDDISGGRGFGQDRATKWSELDGIMSNQAQPLVAKRTIRLAGLSGTEYTLRGPSTYEVFRYYRSQGTVFMARANITYFGKKGEMPPKEFAHFFNSFKILNY